MLAVFATPSFAVLPRANDDFVKATVLSGPAVSLDAQTNDAATGQPGEPNHAGTSLADGCRDATTRYDGLTDTGCLPSVWYSWTPTRSGDVVIDTCDPAANPPDTTLAVYTGTSVDALGEVASNNDSIDCPYASKVAFTALAGTTYHIAVSGSRGGTVNFPLHLLQEFAPNDDFAAATPLAGDSIDLAGQTTVNATGQPGEPNHGGFAFRDSCSGPTLPDRFCLSSVWYTWSSAADAIVTVDLCDPTTKVDTVLAVYSGSALGGLSQIASNDDAVPFCPGADESDYASRLSFRAAAGTTYRIAVAGFHAAHGHFALHLRASPAAPLPSGGPVPPPPAEPTAPPAAIATPPAPSPGALPAAPLLSPVVMSHSVFSVGTGFTAVSAGLPKRAAVGTKFLFTLSEPARVSIAIARRTAGRRKGIRCVRPSAALRHATRCTRLIAVGTLGRASKQGANSVAFSGRIGARALRPGRYRAALRAIDAAGARSARRVVFFRVVRG